MNVVIELLKKHHVSGKTLLRLYIASSILMGVFAYCVLVFLFLILYKYGLVSSIYIAMSIIFFIMLKLISKMNNRISKISKKILLSVDKGISYTPAL